MKLILQILLILVVISTAVICTAKPELHKTVFVYDSAYKLVPEEEVRVEKEEIPIMEKPSSPKVTTNKTENIVTKTPVQKTISNTVRTVQNQTPKKQMSTQSTKITTPKVTTQVSQNVVEKPKTEIKTQVQQLEQPQKQVVKTETPKVQTTTVQNEPPKVLTQQEENIAWNIWRSNLQNQIMRDAKLPLLPNGIVFRFTFTVDKFGKVTNVQTWSDTPNYTPYAIQYIAPVIRSYQGRSILKFPEGTARTVTNVKGGWKISDNERYSSPSDYNDVEKVIH